MEETIKKLKDYAILLEIAGNYDNVPYLDELDWDFVLNELEYGSIKVSEERIKQIYKDEKIEGKSLSDIQYGIESIIKYKL
jgi:hypothetical protein